VITLSLETIIFPVFPCFQRVFSFPYLYRGKHGKKDFPLSTLFLFELIFGERALKEESLKEGIKKIQFCRHFFPRYFFSEDFTAFLTITS